MSTIISGTAFYDLIHKHIAGGDVNIRVLDDGEVVARANHFEPWMKTGMRVEDPDAAREIIRDVAESSKTLTDADRVNRGEIARRF